MNDKDKILLLYSDLLSEKEKAKLEDDIKHFPELQPLKNQIENKLKDVAQLNVSEVSESYLSQTRAKVIERLSNTSHSFFKYGKYVTAAGLMIALFFIIKNFDFSDKNEFDIQDYELQEYFSFADENDLREFEEKYFQSMQEYSTEDKVNYINQYSFGNYELYQTASSLDDEIIKYIENKNDFLTR